MLDKFYQIAGYVLVLIFLTLPIVAREYSSAFQECITKQAAVEGSKQQKESAPSILIARAFAFECTGAFLNKNGNAITAVETALIAFFTFTLWGATKAQRVHDREVFRAYVSGGGPLDGTGNFLLFTIDNNGRTPAAMVAYAVEFCPLNRIPRIPAYDVPNYQRVPYAERIPPGRVMGITTPIPIPPDIPRPLLAYGRYWYTDIWKKTHSSGFVLVVEAAGTHGRVPQNIPPAYTDWD
jgi:hypothetical protein